MQRPETTARGAGPAWVVPASSTAPRGVGVGRVDVLNVTRVWRLDPRDRLGIPLDQLAAEIDAAVQQRPAVGAGQGDRMPGLSNLKGVLTERE